jgi:hypothetical protein
MWHDPIVEEIHQTRERIAQMYDNDIHAIFEAARHGELSKQLIADTNNLIKNFVVPNSTTIEN